MSGVDRGVRSIYRNKTNKESRASSEDNGSGLFSSELSRQRGTMEEGFPTARSKLSNPTPGAKPALPRNLLNLDFRLVARARVILALGLQQQPLNKTVGRNPYLFGHPSRNAIGRVKAVLPRVNLSNQHSTAINSARPEKNLIASYFKQLRNYKNHYKSLLVAINSMGIPGAEPNQ